jgi:hypothetical protein
MFDFGNNDDHVGLIVQISLDHATCPPPNAIEVVDELITPT